MKENKKPIEIECLIRDLLLNNRVKKITIIVDYDSNKPS